MLVHVFSTKAREYYGLERLWRNAKVVPVHESASNPSGVEVPVGAGQPSEASSIET